MGFNISEFYIVYRRVHVDCTHSSLILEFPFRIHLHFSLFLEFISWASSEIVRLHLHSGDDTHTLELLSN